MEAVLLSGEPIEGESKSLERFDKSQNSKSPVTFRHKVTSARVSSSRVRQRIVEWMTHHPPHIMNYKILMGPEFKFGYGNARKFMERLVKEGSVRRIQGGVFELTQKPLDFVFKEATRHILGTVHHALVGAEMPRLRVNGLQLVVDLGEAGRVAFRHLEAEHRVKEASC